VLAQLDAYIATVEAALKALIARQIELEQAGRKPVLPSVIKTSVASRKAELMNGYAPPAAAAFGGDEELGQIVFVERPAMEQSIEDSRNEHRRTAIKTLAGTFARNEAELRPILAAERWHVEEMQKLNKLRTEICLKTFRKCHGMVRSVFYVPWAGFELCGRARDTSGEASEFLDALDKAGIRAAKPS
jgi:hypothetical protein